MPERAPASNVDDPEPEPHCLAWVRTLQALAPLASSTKMPEIAVGPRNGMLLQVADARMTAAPLVGVKPPNSGPPLPDPQAASEMKRIAAAAEGRWNQVLLSLSLFEKRTQKAPPHEIRLAERRLADWRRRGAAMRKAKKAKDL